MDNSFRIPRIARTMPKQALCTCRTQSWSTLMNPSLPAFPLVVPRQQKAYHQLHHHGATILEIFNPVLRIQNVYPRSEFFHPRSASRIQVFLTQKTVSKLSESYLGFHLRSRIQGVNKAPGPGPGSGSATLFQSVLWIWVRIGSEFSYISVSGSGFRKAKLEKQQIKYRLSLKICQLFSFSRAGGFFLELGSIIPSKKCDFFVLTFKGKIFVDYYYKHLGPGFGKQPGSGSKTQLTTLGRVSSLIKKNAMINVVKRLYGDEVPCPHSGKLHCALIVCQSPPPCIKMSFVWFPKMFKLRD